MTTASQILAAYDSVELWDPGLTSKIQDDVAGAYGIAQDVANRRQQRGERHVGYKIGFTTEAAMSSFGLLSPMWGRVWDTTLTSAARDLVVSLSLTNYVQPKIEPEFVVRFRGIPKLAATKADIYSCIESVGVGIELVQCHCDGWAISAPIAIADGGLHAQLVVGEWIPLELIASNAEILEERLRAATVELVRNARDIQVGAAKNVLGSPLTALTYFFADPSFRESANTFSNAPFIVTTGSWTQPIEAKPGDTWAASFSSGLGKITISFDA